MRKPRKSIPRCLQEAGPDIPRSTRHNFCTQPLGRTHRRLILQFSIILCYTGCENRAGPNIYKTHLLADCNRKASITVLDAVVVVGVDSELKVASGAGSGFNLVAMNGSEDFVERLGLVWVKARPEGAEGVC